MNGIRRSILSILIIVSKRFAPRHAPLAGISICRESTRSWEARGVGVGRTVGLVHAVIPAIEPLRAAFGQLAPEVKLINILDEGLVTEIDRRGSLTPGLVRRLTSLITLAEE